MSSNKRSQGIIRRKFDVFVARKEALRAKAPRFGKSKIVGSGSTTASQPGNFNIVLGDSTNRQQPLIELARVASHALPPQWVVRYQECEQLIAQIDQIKRNMALDQNRRLTCIKQSDEKLIDERIYSSANEATRKIRKCEAIINTITKQAEYDNQFDKKTCENICKKLAVQIQQKTREIRAQQRAYIEYRRQFQNTAKVSFLELTAQKMLQDPTFNDEQLIEEESLFDVQRNQQLLNIVNSIHELNDIYKELSTLVVMQGTLLDRIDENIEVSVQKVKDGVEALGRAQQHQKSKTGCIVMLILVGVICILGLVLIIKHR